MQIAFWTLLILNYLVAIAIIIHILLNPREPRAMLSWIFAVFLLPVIGSFSFWAIGTPRLERTKRKRRRRRQRLAVSLSRRPPLDQMHAARVVRRLAPATRHLMKIATKVGSYPPTHSNRVAIYHNEEQSLITLHDMIASARSHVHLEYYIFRPDETGAMIRDALIARARAGVQVRVLVDYLGSWSLTRAFIHPMVRAGIQFDYFLPVVPWQGPWRVNFRNHRKILIIDGKIAFTGSHNIGDEYRGRHPRLGTWQDTNLSIEGPAVQQLQEVFVEDWYYTTGHELVSDEYFPAPEPVGPHVVQVIPSGPDVEANPILDVVFSAITGAHRSICIMTPYFVPDAALIQALHVAARGGAKVQILIPARNDNPLVLWAGRSFYKEVIRAGVEIYEYDHGMLHNKVVVIDEHWSLVGSANMDHRSFRLNFELSTVLYDAGLARDLLADFRSFLAHARRIAPDGRTAWTVPQAVTLGAARLVSPLL